MIIKRVWQMPNSNTFMIPAIKKLIMKYYHKNSIDPFANKNRIATITNDLDPQYKTDYCLDAIEFLKQFKDTTIDFVLYDPPYSARQISECYKALNMSVNMETTQGSYWANQKAQIGRITKDGGICISFGWNRSGIGKKYGFEIIEILLVPHGGAHYDTIVVVERKMHTLFNS